MSEFAPGMPDPRVYGEPTRKLKPGGLVSYVLQKHETRRRPGRPHYDMRLGTPDTNLFSWAVPKAQLPGPGDRRLAPQTQLHTHNYGDFSGPISHGYGAGNVEMADKGKALITKTSPNSVSFTVAHSRIPTRYALIKINTKSGRDWLLINRSKVGKVPGIGTKPQMRLIQAADVDDAMDKATFVQEKIDGAHGIYEVGPAGQVEAYSVRPRKGGQPIVHTERLGLEGVRAPKELRGTVLRGEIYGKRKSGKRLAFSEVSGILNTAVAKAREKQETEGIGMENALFDVIQHRGKDVSKLPYAERLALLKTITKQLPRKQFHAVNTARTKAQKAKMIEDIRTGRNPRTSEGVVMRMPGNKTWKLPFTKERTGYITGTFPGEGKRKATAGGLTFELEPGGVPGRVGTGFTDQELTDIVGNIEENIGRPIRLGHKQELPSGKLRAPSFKGFETDKLTGKTANDFRYLHNALTKPQHLLKSAHIEQMYKRAEEAPEGKCWAVRWADGRGIQCFRQREHAQAWYDSGKDHYWFESEKGPQLIKAKKGWRVKKKANKPFKCEEKECKHPSHNDKIAEIVKLAREIESHSYSCVMITVEGAAAKKLRAFARAIPDDELQAPDETSDAREMDPHITVKYGLHTNSPTKVFKLLRDQAPVKVKFGKVSIFENEDYDVVKIGVTSTALRKLNKLITSTLKVTDTYPDYKPHATIAYVKKGEGKKYAGRKDIEGTEMVLDQIDFSSKENEHSYFTLKAEKKAVATQWWGCDLDGTLAKYDGWKGPNKIGEPIPRMVKRVKKWLADGKIVKIMTARVASDSTGSARKAVQAWCKKNLGQVLPVTNKKDCGMVELWDDRVVGVQKNTGMRKKADVTLDIVDPQGTVKASVHAEIADTPTLRRIGLSKRAELPQGHGMFFDTCGAYHMKDVNFPLDIVFTDVNGIIVEKQAMALDEGPRLYRPTAKTAAHALELPAGWFKAQALKIGDKIQVAIQ